MNLPNKITVARIILIPIFLLLMLLPSKSEMDLLGQSIPTLHFYGALLFIVASMTDWVDGYLARKYKLVTNLGKFLDPLADKLLVSAALISLVQLQLAPAWMVIVIISREFAVTGLRLVAAGEGEVLAASQLGKIKTVAQMIAIIVLLLHNIPFSIWSVPFGMVMLWIAVFFTVLSGLDYFAKNKQVVLNSK